MLVLGVLVSVGYDSVEIWRLNLGISNMEIVNSWFLDFEI
jgi:hypothetical protein